MKLIQEKDFSLVTIFYTKKHLKGKLSSKTMSQGKYIDI